MTAIRQDAWTSNEDLLLAEIVLTHIRNGSTQLKAFEEAGVKLKRTAAACGFRWNSLVRKQYKKGIEIAKKERKNRHPEQEVPIIEPLERHSNIANELMTVDEIASFFQKLKSIVNEISKVQLENESYQQENIRLQNIIAEQEQELEQFTKLQSEYETLLDILNHARARNAQREIVSS